MKSDLEERLGYLRAPGADRDAVRAALAEGILAREAFASMPPDDLRDLTEAFAAVQGAVADLRRTMQRTGRLGAVAAGTSGLERELRSLEQDGMLRMKREDVDFLGDGDPGDPKKGGRPRAPWLVVTMQRLRAAGLSKEESRELCELAGLTGPTPRKETPPET